MKKKIIVAIVLGLSIASACTDNKEPDSPRINMGSIGTAGMTGSTKMPVESPSATPLTMVSPLPVASGTMQQ